MAPTFGGEHGLLPLWWSLSLGACLGGNGTAESALRPNLTVRRHRRSAAGVHGSASSNFAKVAFPLKLLTIAISHCSWNGGIRDVMAPAAWGEGTWNRQAFTAPNPAVAAAEGAFSCSGNARSSIFVTGLYPFLDRNGGGLGDSLCFHLSCFSLREFL
jgi:hypothetical protein